MVLRRVSPRVAKLYAESFVHLRVLRSYKSCPVIESAVLMQ